MIEEKITKLLEDKFKEAEFSDCFLIEINLLPSNKLEIFIDSDTGITFEKCRRISRYLEQFIDAEGWLGEKYILEVSSPGIKRPLKLKRQYPKNVGRKVEVHLKAGPLEKGKLIKVEENNITLEESIRVKVGKKKKTEIIQKSYSL